MISMKKEGVLGAVKRTPTPIRKLRCFSSVWYDSLCSAAFAVAMSVLVSMGLVSFIVLLPFFLVVFV